MFLREDPGVCPICGAAHATCSATSGPILIAQTPSRDSAVSVPLTEPIATGTYRRQPKK